MLDNLNPKQLLSVKQISGPVLVVAGPGSGKTKALTHRIAYLINLGVSPNNILAVTFTNKAAGEMRSRVSKLLFNAVSSQQSAASSPPIGTFHSICARILRKEARAIGFSPGFSIYDEEDKLKLLKNIIKDLSLDQKQFNASKLQSIISSQKDKLKGPDDIEIDTSFMETIARVYDAYQRTLSEQNAMDFDDLIMKTVELFEKNPVILRKYQEQFKYILVDEFQDTNLGQYKIAKMLAWIHKNIYCIGDLDQSIYSFRGADYKNIIRFEHDWPSAKVITLEQNYRSTQNILDAAKNIISHNRWVIEKNLWTKNGRGEKVFLKEAADEMQEGEFIVSEIEKLALGGLKLRDFVVLYRTNAQSRAIEESFLRNSLPYKIVGGIKFYQRKEVKDLMAFLRLCINEKDALAMQRARSVPTKFLISNSQFSIFKPRRHSKSGRGAQQKPKSKNQILETLAGDFNEKGKKLNLTDFLTYIIKKTGFEDYLRDGTEKGEERWANIGELISVASKYDKEKPEGAIRMLIEEASLAQDTDNIEYEKDLVNLMTLHSAKGLEFPVVFIAGCEQGLLPHARTFFRPEEELEEERRLCYVGITRAKERLYMIFAKTRMMFGKIQANPPSEFLGDIPGELAKFMPSEEQETIIELD